MLRQLAAGLLVLVASPLFAATSDLRILSMFPTRTTVTTGERFTVTMRWRNDGPDQAFDVKASLGIGSDAFVVTGAGTSNWPCEPEPGVEGFSCIGVIHAGAEAEMVVTMLAPSTPRTAWVLQGSVLSSSSDPQPANNTASVTLQVSPAGRTADLSMQPATQELHVDQGAAFTIPVVVRNAGPDAAQNLIASFSWQERTVIPITASGGGWACANATHSPQLVVCRLASLAPGETAPLAVSVAAAPRQDAVFHFYGRVAAEGNHDPDDADARSLAGVHVGAIEDWRRILVPLMPAEVPGANGARWRTETSMLVRSVTAPEILPRDCDVDPQLPCEPLPLNRPFPLEQYAASTNFGGGQFLYYHASDEPLIHLNSRVHDVAREAQTAGSEIPLAREEDFTSGTISLVGIPVAPQYRHTLRVYGFEPRAGAAVVVRVYANQERDPRASVVRTLSLREPMLSVTPQQLPVHPAYLQLDPATLASLEGATTMRVEVDPLEAGLRLWSFVSITNNDTHHVTTFTAQ